MLTELARSRPGSLAIALASQEAPLQVADGIYLSEGASNSYLVTTPDGDVLINTGLGVEAPAHKHCYEQVSRGPIRYILLTQGHVDHVGGTGLFKAAHPEAILVANRHTGEHQRFDALTSGARVHGSIRFYGEMIGAMDEAQKRAKALGHGEVQAVAKPDVHFDSDYEFELGGLRCRVEWLPGGETLDSSMIHLPQRDVLFTGNAFGPLFPHLPNLCTPRGDRMRFALPYLDICERVLALEPELLLTGHFKPIEGRALIHAELSRLRDAVSHVHEQTVAAMNAGRGMYEAMRSVELPDALEVGQSYATVPWLVRSIYEGYLGWFRQDSVTEMYSVPARDIYAELGELAGADALSARSAAALAAGEAERAVHLAEVALAAAPEHAAARDAMLAALRRLRAGCVPDNRWQVRWLDGEIERHGG